MSNRHRLAAAFSLVEVLIAVIVLAIGLLGLGAVIPVIVREQRIASESTLAISAINSARAYLDAADIPWGDLRQSPGTGVGDADLLAAGDETLTTRLAMNEPTSVWVPLRIDPDTGAATERVTNHFDSITGGDPLIEIPLAERLYPNPRSGGIAPRLVWDVAARRMITRDWEFSWYSPSATDAPSDKVRPALTGSDQIQLAIFIRLLDPGIRVRPGETLMTLMGRPNTINAASPANMPSNPLWPVAVRDNGTPSRDGRGSYSTPVAAPVKNYEFDGSEEYLTRDYLVLDFSDVESDDDLGVFPFDDNGNEIESTPRELATAAAQPGQKLIDAWGRVYTVVGPAPRSVSRAYSGGAPVVRITPPVPTWIQNTLQLGDLCFTPQVPAEVILLEVEP